MLAKQSLIEGRLTDALSQLQDQIRKEPSRAEYRTFLFQLLSVLGQWERALTQLKVAGELDAGTLAMVKMYETALNCEAFRQQVFAGLRSPLIFGQPPEWIALLLEALRLETDNKLQQSQSVRNQAFELAPAIAGSINGQPFAWISDADPRLGPVFEAIINGQYYWIPQENIQSIQIEEPSDLRDVVWMPAHFNWRNGGEIVGLIPARYPGSEQSDDPMIQLSRKTDWSDEGNELYIGYGQRMLATDNDEYPLMEVRDIQFETDANSALPEADEQG
ncbi:virulence protein SciE type [Vibrio albus]|uniref:Virulence protein SciE type n=1 Tax=Vibrio albus TaxID=2200953 RepID=A0A2U3BBD6_9VIBR|nr:type VI secretion system accessory protein TagJ [Vibrio albus]PWI34100.1 virulence protein SciE type [Vibrio albus]